MPVSEAATEFLLGEHDVTRAGFRALLRELYVAGVLDTAAINRIEARMEAEVKAFNFPEEELRQLETSRIHEITHFATHEG